MKKIQELDEIIFDFLESYEAKTNFQEKLSLIKSKHKLSSDDIKNYLIFFKIYSPILDEFIN